MSEESRLKFLRPQVPHDGPVHLADANPDWPGQYAQVASSIREALDGLPVTIEHVGSTSVPDLAAKPIIDVVVLVPDPADEAAYVPALEGVGFMLQFREPDWFEHRFLNGTDPPTQVHVFRDGSTEAQRMLLFRDRLRDHPSERQRYESVKRQLAARHWTSVQDYADAKSEVVEEIIARAGAPNEQGSRPNVPRSRQ